MSVELNTATASGDLPDSSGIPHCNGRVNVASEKLSAGADAMGHAPAFKFDFVSCDQRFLSAELYGNVIEVDGRPTLVPYSPSFAGSSRYIKVET